MLKREFDEKIKSLGLTRQDFCNITGLAYSSVSNWNDNNKPIPIWVDTWLLNYEKSLALDELLKILEKYKNKEKLE
ncbi:TPA: hypothetical protein SG769_000677 [Campylobacter coli]|nr:hypothetical protein [Campylobacter coli]